MQLYKTKLNERAPSNLKKKGEKKRAPLPPSPPSKSEKSPKTKTAQRSQNARHLLLPEKVK